MLVGDVEGKTDWDLADLTGGPKLSSPVSIHRCYRRPYKMCSVLSESFFSSAANLLSLAILTMDAMSKSSIF